MNSDMMARLHLDWNKIPSQSVGHKDQITFRTQMHLHLSFLMHLWTMFRLTC